MSLISTFENDPFFSNANLSQALALEHRLKHERQLSQHRELKSQNGDVFGNPLALMQNVMNHMGKMISQMENTNHSNVQQGRGVSFSSSTVISMNRRNGGKPKIFQATTEKLAGPEGLERTRKAVRDTSRNLEKIEVAHRLGERGHRITRERDPSSGKLIENREFEYIDDENQFEREWLHRAEGLGLKTVHINGFDSSRKNLSINSSAFKNLRSQSQEPRRLPIEQRQSTNEHSRHNERRRRKK